MVALLTGLHAGDEEKEAIMECGSLPKLQNRVTDGGAHYEISPLPPGTGIVMISPASG